MNYNTRGPAVNTLADCGNACETVRTSNMESAISLLQGEVEQSEKALASLHERLQGVLLPKPQDDQKVASVPQPTFAPLPNHIRELSTRLYSVRRGMQSLLESLEV